jgi:hypothetical protein
MGRKLERTIISIRVQAWKDFFLFQNVFSVRKRRGIDNPLQVNWKLTLYG